MIQIKCTAFEKELITSTIMCTQPCILGPDGCNEDNSINHCYECINKNIKWEVIEDGDNQD